MSNLVKLRRKKKMLRLSLPRKYKNKGIFAKKLRKQFETRCLFRNFNIVIKADVAMIYDKGDIIPENLEIRHISLQSCPIEPDRARGILG